jgi:TetR/AcrR family transcriptional repressor of uid operon
MPRLSAEQRQNHRQRIVDAAWSCVARTGYCDLRVEDICAQAGVSKGSFYLYFKRKDDVLIALLEEDAAKIEQRIRSVVLGNRPGIDRLRLFAQTMLADHDNQGRMQVRADLWAEMFCEKTVRDRFVEHLDRRRRLLSEAISEGIATGEFDGGVPAETLARILLATVDGLMLHAAAAPKSMRWPKLRQGVDGLLAGLRAA